MKYLKMLGLAAIAAMALMALFGAGSASATTLCTTTTGSCYPAGTEFHASLTKDAKGETTARLTSPAGTTVVTCSGSTMLGDLTKETETWLGIRITKLLWEGCTSHVETTALGELEVMWKSEDEGEVRAKETTVDVELFGVACQFGAGEGTTLGTMKGGEAPILSIEAKVKKTSGGFLCPSEPIWDATYVLTAPHAVHVKTP